jgi:23S rRNA (adenine2030-N6)-methyltransferase
MFSYRHAFHAGNHADVLKHAVLISLLKYLTQKDKPFWVVDTHAGAGAYSLDTGQATKKEEYAEGVARLIGQDGLPALLKDYVNFVHAFNDRKGLRRYPGSPTIAARLTRPDDRLRFFEMHSTDYRLLSQLFGDADKRVQVKKEDGLAGLKALLPPPATSRRALVVIDPSYEDKRDYMAIPAAVHDGLRRFPEAVFLVWYPLLQIGAARRMPEQLQRGMKGEGGHDWLNVSLTVRKPAKDGFGMHGTGLFVVNPPYVLPGLLQAAMPVLVERLGIDDTASFKLDYEIA